jgi:hypothetical protein
MQEFLENVYDYTMIQSEAGVSALEKILRYIFAVDSRNDLMFVAQRMMVTGTDEYVEAAYNSQLPKAVALALRYS